MKTIEEMKNAHEQQMNVTDFDEFYYQAPKPLTDEQKNEMMMQVDEIKKMTADRDLKERNWIEKHFEDKTLKDN